MRSRTFLACVLAATLACAVFGQGTGEADGSADRNAEAARQLEALVTKNRSAGVLGESDMRKAIELAATLGRPHSAASLVKNFLSQTPNPSPALLKMAAENAWLSGDYRGAIVIQKTYCMKAPAGAEASAAAARLYRMYWDLTDSQDVYAFMTQNGESLRSGVEARKYDRWYLDMAWAGKDVESVARRLAACFADKVPLAQEREFFWDDLDRLIEATRRDDGTAYKALPHMRKLAGLIRESPWRTAQLTFQTEFLAFNAESRGKDAATLEKDFAPVLAAAQAWFNAAPSGGTLQSICAAWANGFEGNWPEAWKRGGPAKDKFFAECFLRLQDPDRTLVVEKCGRVAGPDAWLDLIKATSPGPERNRWASMVPISSKFTDRAACQTLAPALAGVWNRPAAVTRSLAVTNDLAACLKHMVEQESWCFDLRDDDGMAYSGIEREILDGFAALPSEGAGRDARDRQTALRVQEAQYLISFYFQSPVPALVGSARNQTRMDLVWGTVDRAKMPEYLHLLDWVPMTEEARAEVYKNIRENFRRWSEQVRRQEAEAKKSPEKKQEWDAAIALIDRIDVALRQVTDPKVFNAGRAPSPLAGHLVALSLAEGRKDTPGALAAARNAYALVRDYEEKKVPFGRLAFRVLISPRKDVDMLDFQCEVLEDQLARQVQSGRSDCGLVVDAILSGQRSRTLGETADQGRIRIEGAIAKATLAMLDAGKFNGTVFDLYRQVRLENDSSRKIFAKLVESKALRQNPGYQVAPLSPNPYDRRSTAATKYQWLLAREFSWLNDKYPRDSYFDDLFAQEIAEGGVIDPMFWRDSSDKAHKGANAAAAVLKRFGALPLGYDGSRPSYTTAEWREILASVDAHADAGPRGEMMAAAEAAFGTARFDDWALGMVRLERIDAKQPDARKQWFGQLKTVLDRAATVPRLVTRPGISDVLKMVRQADESKDYRGALQAPSTDEELALLLRMYAELPCGPCDAETVMAGIELVQNSLTRRERTSELLAFAPAFFGADRLVGGYAYQIGRPLCDKIESFSKAGQMPLAATYAGVAITLRNGVDGNQRKRCEATRTMALGLLGGASSSVVQGDRRYPIYAVQAAFVSGQTEQAWRDYLKARDLVESELRQLDPKFIFWVVGKAIERGELAEARRVARLMLAAVNAGEVIFADAEDRAGLELMYADIGKAAQEYPLAKAQYERIAMNNDYAATRAKMTALLRIAEVMRLTGDYTGAESKLTDLLKSRDPSVASRAALSMAQVKFDKGEYGPARDNVKEALRIDPDIVEARVLEGEIDLRTRKLMEAARVAVSDLVTAQRVLVPGRPLSVRIEDRNLAVIGTKMAIEVRVWTAGGDEELFNLMPYGDSKTKYEGNISSELGVPVKGDHKLNVLGGDKVYYDFSARFRKATAMPEKDTLAPPLTVVSDSEMLASSGDIALKDVGMEQRMEAILKKVQADPLSEERRVDQIKPGNSIRIRVIDPDQSTTTGRDKAYVKATATSGDSVARLALEETEAVSGVFDGELKTAVAPAAARASDTSPGSDPAAPISAGDHPPWVAQVDNRRPKSYTVDMNDRIALKTLSILADVPARGLKNFRVQTSLSGDDFTTVGTWPKVMETWDGALQMTAMRFPLALDRQWQDGKVLLKDKLRVVRDFMTLRGLGPDYPEPVVAPGAPSSEGGVLSYGARRDLGLESDPASPNAWFLVCLRGGFYIETAGERAIRILSRDVAGQILLVDGELQEPPKVGPLTVSKYFERGVHSLEYYFWASSEPKAKPAYSIEWDIPEEPYFAACPADIFDISKHPEIPEKMTFTPATVTARDGDKAFDIEFRPGSNARLLRLALLDFEGDAPALRKLTVHDTQDRQVLPTQVDLLELRKNDVLEISAGDEITITYEDPTPLVRDNRVRTARLAATYNNGGIGASVMHVTTDKSGRPVGTYVGVRRYRQGQTINVFINDPDCDVSAGRDTVPFTVRTTSGTNVQLKAVESSRSGEVLDARAAHSGVFFGRFFTVDRAPEREGEIQVTKDDALTISYMDKENTDYGIPWERTTFVEQAPTFGTPVVRGFDTTSSVLPDGKRIEEPPPKDKQVTLVKSGTPSGGNAMEAELNDEFVPTRRTLHVRGRVSPTNDAMGATHVLGVAQLEVTWPAVALSGMSRVQFYAQTFSSRRLAGVTNDAVFDPAMPGTMPIVAGPGNAVAMPRIPGYDAGTVLLAEPVDPRARYRLNSPLDLGVFCGSVPLQLGEPSTLTREEREARAKDSGGKGQSVDFMAGEVSLNALPVRGGDDGIVIAMPYNTNAVAYENGDLGSNWIIRAYTLFCDPFLDVMDKEYSEPLHLLYMSDTAYLRVIDPAGDVTGQKDEIRVEVRAGSGEPVTITLMETFPHSAVFKGLLETALRQEAAVNMRPGLVGTQYGEEISVSYTGGSARETVKRTFKMKLGADGMIQSFTRRFKDPEIAIQTQFTVAESYFELAKSHRKLNQVKLATQEIAQGRKMLEEAIRDFPDNKAKAQAEYLLAELSLELSYDAETPDQKRKLAADALQRFSDVVLNYPTHEYAIKAQFKKALALEKMGEIHQACEEYMKLAYKFPDSPLVAETIARLGNYFLVQGRELQARKEASASKDEQARLDQQMKNMYTTAGDVFRRLSPRFPAHKLAAQTTVLAGQCYMRASAFERAVNTFDRVIQGDRKEPETVAEAMYWCAMSYMSIATSKQGNSQMQGIAAKNAFIVLKNLTWDYPDSQWAKWARGKLATEQVFARMDM